MESPLKPWNPSNAMMDAQSRLGSETCRACRPHTTVPILADYLEFEMILQNTKISISSSARSR